MSTASYKKLLPVIVIALALVLFLIMRKLRPEVQRKEPAPNHPKVEVFTVTTDSHKIMIPAQGTVQPRQQTRLTARVSGHIVWVSPDFYEGGRFDTGTVLLRLDPLPYKSALAEARSRLALAQSAYLQETELAEQARLDWSAVGGGEPSPLVLREPQLAKAEADLEAATVAVQMATENLSYSEIKAPYPGRVNSKLVDVGQAITAQTTVLGEIFSTEAMEVPLALSLDDLSLVINTNGQGERPQVLLDSTIGGTRHTWQAYLDRTAASVNERTRMILVYARMDPPFLSDNGRELQSGMFVNASIEGKNLPQAARIPRGAVHPGNIVHRLDAANRLEAIPVEIVHTDQDWVIISNGLAEGDRLCMTPLLFFVDGMQVEPVGEKSGQTTTPTEPAP